MVGWLRRPSPARCGRSPRPRATGPARGRRWCGSPATRCCRRSAGVRLERPEKLDELDDILETNEQWQGCWYRIDADADRREITCAAADAGVDWDTSDVPEGVYVVEGYVWDPPLSQWSTRPGVLKVVDDPESGPPAAAISASPGELYADQTGVVEGCIDAPEGSTFVGSWAVSRVVGEPQWEPFTKACVAGRARFALEFVPPEAAVGESAVMFRVDVTDPEGRTYTAYRRRVTSVIGFDDPEQCDGTGGGFIGDPGCESGEGSPDPFAGLDPDVVICPAGSGEPIDEGTTGCGCRTGAPAPHPVALSVLLLWRRTQRRRR